MESVDGIFSTFHTHKEFFPTLQVATALLVAGPTLTFLIPWQTPFASTSSYSSVVQSTSLRLVPINAHVIVETWRPKRRQNMIITAVTIFVGLSCR